MKVKLKTIYASETATAGPGTTIEVPDAEGRALVAGNYGEEVVDRTADRRETATTKPVEKAQKKASETATTKPAEKAGG